MLVWLILLGFCATLIPLVGLLCLCLYVAMYRGVRHSKSPKTSLGRSAAVVVLGDIGRSPRMCYHVESFANEGWKVSIVGYKGVPLPPALQRSSIKSHFLRTPPKFIAKLPRMAFALVAPFKILLQSVSLFWELSMEVSPSPEIILVQTPPALPTLAVVRIVSTLIRSKVIIDWHNLGYTILALRMGQKSPLVKLAENLERWTGRSAYAHLFVTNAMKNHLNLKWNLKGKKVVLHDRPPKHFRRSTTDEAHQLLGRLVHDLQPPLGDSWLPPYQLPHTTPFTTTIASNTNASEDTRMDRKDELNVDHSLLDTSPPSAKLPRPNTNNGSADPPSSTPASSTAQWRQDRPALIVSSTSWTADEDFGLLLDAARLYEKRARELAAIAEAKANSTDNSTNSSYRQYAHNRASQGDSGSSLSPISSSPTSYNPPSSTLSEQSGAEDGPALRLSKERRRPSLGTLRTATLPHEPATLLPKILIIVTGKGELKARYVAEIASLEAREAWQYVRIRTSWLSSEDYPTLLGSADIGVSLHTSSSGLDLPMKVVDMLGCGLPVCALDFACLDELVVDQHNGLIFRDKEGLARQWESLLAMHPAPNWLMTGIGMVEPFDRLVVAPPASSNSVSGSRTGTPQVFSLPSYALQQLQQQQGGVGVGGGNAEGIYPAIPMSPNPSLTLLHSPILGSHPLLKVKRGPRSTWTGNWKHCIRPLLNASADHNNDEDDGDDDDDDGIGRWQQDGEEEEEGDVGGGQKMNSGGGSDSTVPFLVAGSAAGDRASSSGFKFQVGSVGGILHRRAGAAAGKVSSRGIKTELTELPNLVSSGLRRTTTRRRNGKEDERESQGLLDGDSGDEIEIAEDEDVHRYGHKHEHQLEEEEDEWILHPHPPNQATSDHTRQTDEPAPPTHAHHPSTNTTTTTTTTTTINSGERERDRDHDHDRRLRQRKSVTGHKQLATAAEEQGRIPSIEVSHPT